MSQLNQSSQPSQPPTSWYFYCLKRDDFIAEFCVAAAVDPEQTVETMAADGTMQKWRSRWRGDLLVFTPPDGYAGSQPLLWKYDRRLQHGEAIQDRRLLEKYALGNRTSS